MNKISIKCHLGWILFISIIGMLLSFTGLSTIIPDATKNWLSQSSSDAVDAFNLKNKPQKEQETYKKRDRSHIEPSVFELSE